MRSKIGNWLQLLVTGYIRRNFVTSPIRQDGADGTGATLYDNHDKVGIRVVLNLVLCPGWDESKVSGT